MQVVDLFVEVPTLPVQIGHFQRIGKTLVLQEALKWDAERDGAANVVSVGTLDSAQKWSGPFICPAWSAGGSLAIQSGDLVVQNWSAPGEPQRDFCGCPL